jgi:flagellar export protein FliJ
MYFPEESNAVVKVSQKSRFRSVLKVKKLQERRAQGELHELQTVHAREEETLNDIKDERQYALSDAFRTMKMKATEAQTSRAFILRLSRQIKEQEKKVEQVGSQEEDKRTELVERTKSKKMVEQLDEKLQTEANKESERKEQRLIDVLAQRIRSEIL